MAFTVKLDSSGRIMIPAPLRKQLNLSANSLLHLDAQEGGILLITHEEAIRRAKDLFKGKAPGRVLSQELLADRRAEAKRELGRSR